MNLKRIDHIGVVVESPEPLTTMLERDLELSVTRRIDNQDLQASFHACGDASLEVIWVKDHEARQARLGDGVRARIEHVAIEVDDLEATLAALAAVGIEPTAPPREGGGAMSVWTRPETSGGIVLQFMQRVAS
jgi:methylmalonyl-CoA/ethylmalonyl-CoA epimerase